MNPNFQKNQDGLLPAVVQDAQTQTVLMLGYMNEEALQKTQQTGMVTFFSRSKQRLWTKGETSGNFLELKEILLDCDQDTLLIKAIPRGVVCHTGADTCFEEKNNAYHNFFYRLENIIQERLKNPDENSYTHKLSQKGIAKVGQKVGEEAVETLIEAIKGDKEKLLEESADLMYHLILLLQLSNTSLQEVEQVLLKRHKQ